MQTLDNYLEELTDNNWHTLRELIELQQGKLEDLREMQALNAYECAIGYLLWERENQDGGKQGLLEYITRRIF